MLTKGAIMSVSLFKKVFVGVTTALLCLAGVATLVSPGAEEGYRHFARLGDGLHLYIQKHPETTVESDQRRSRVNAYVEDSKGRRTYSTLHARCDGGGFVEDVRSFGGGVSLYHSSGGRTGEKLYELLCR